MLGVSTRGESKPEPLEELLPVRRSS